MASLPSGTSVRPALSLSLLSPLPSPSNIPPRLVATVGSSAAAARKVTRTAIEKVNLRKACEKIIEPGAPIALRVQGNLLYGVSRVYNHQARYVLSDVEKIQADMRMHARLALKTTDPRAGKTR